MLKKINKFVKHASGFNVIATTTLKVKVVMMVSLLVLTYLTKETTRKVSVTFEQKYLLVKTEQKILNNTLALVGKKDEKYVEKLSTCRCNQKSLL